VHGEKICGRKKPTPDEGSLILLGFFFLDFLRASCACTLGLRRTQLKRVHSSEENNSSECLGGHPRFYQGGTLFCSDLLPLAPIFLRDSNLGWHYFYPFLKEGAPTKCGALG